MALDELSSFLVLKAMSYREFSSATIAVLGGEIGFFSAISKMQCISEFHFREAVWGLQPLACFLASENGAFGVAAGIGSVMRLSSRSCRLSLEDCCFCCCHGLGVLCCLKGCRIFQCTNEMAANIFAFVVIQRCEIDCVW